jgi:1,4-dihydroxy-2-naphthoyl-CoA hydrolase
MTDDALSQSMYDEMPFTRALGIETLAAAKDEVRTRMPWSDATCTGGGVMHGGVIMALADSTGAFCAFLNLPEGAGTTTIESKTNFLRGVREGYVEAVSRPLHAGRTVVVIETEMTDANGKLVAKTTQTQAVLAPRG